jgi:hypothetical protein
MPIQQITTGIIADNTVIAADVLDGTLTGAKLAANTLANSVFQTGSVESYMRAVNLDFGLRNRIINGDMRIDQRNNGASVTPNASAYTLDRWELSTAVSSKLSVQQSSTAPAGFRNSVLLTSTSAYTPSSSDYISYCQKIEGFNFADMMWGTANARPVTISFWVRSSLTGTFSGALQNDGAGRSYPFTYTISAANTFEFKTVTIAGDTSGTWNTTTGKGVEVHFNMGSGSNLLGTAGAWASVWNTGATGSVSLVGTNGATWYLTGVQVEEGLQPTPFEYRHYTTELQLCQRYFYKHASGGSGSNDNVIGFAWYYTSSFVLSYIKFPVNMRTNPNAVQTSGTDFYGLYRSGTGDFFNSLTLNTSSVSGVELYNDGQVSGTAGQTGGLVGNSSSMYLGFSAEL